MTLVVMINRIQSRLFQTFWTGKMGGGGRGAPEAFMLPTNSEIIKATTVKLSGLIVRLKLFPLRSRIIS